MFSRRFLVLVLCPLLFAGLSACGPSASPSGLQPPSHLIIGVAPFTQPEQAVQLLAGYVPEQQQKAPADLLYALDDQFAEALSATGRGYVFLPRTALDGPMAEDDRGRRSALATWVDRAHRAGVDLLIVPQLIDWRERVGGSAGVVTPAAVMTDIFLIDVRNAGDGNGATLQRSHYSEEQKALSSNLLSMGTFLQRGGRWVTARDLAGEAMARAIREFGL